MTSSPLFPSSAHCLLRNDSWPLTAFCLFVYFFRTALGEYGGEEPYWAWHFRILWAESQGIGLEGPTGSLRS